MIKIYTFFALALLIYSLSAMQQQPTNREKMTLSYLCHNEERLIHVEQINNQPTLTNQYPLEALQVLKSSIAMTFNAHKPKETGYFCPYCQFITKSNSYLKLHLIKHTGQKPNKCNFPGCSYATIYQNDLKRHLHAHTGEKPYKCPWPGCTYAAVQSGAITVHIRTHTGEKPYQCNWPSCTYKTAYSGCLKNHIFTHTGEKPYKCNWPDCTYATTRAAILNKHISSHHQNKSN